MKIRKVSGVAGWAVNLYPNFSGYDLTNRQHSKPTFSQPWNPRLKLRKTNYMNLKLKNENTAYWLLLLVSQNSIYIHFPIGNGQNYA